MANERNEMTEEVTKALDSALETLHKIWTEIGIVEDQRKDRLKVVMLHLRNLLNEMVKEEERLKDRLMANVETLGEEVMQLSKELRVKNFEPQEGSSMIQLERELRGRAETLQAERGERLKRLKKLRGEDQHLCDVLQHEPYYIPSCAVPTEEQLTELAGHVDELSREKAKRYQIFKTTKENIVKLMDDLEQNAETSFEREVIHEEEDTFQLTSSQLKSLKDLHDSLERKSQKNFALAKGLRERIEQLWDRLDISSSERSSFSAKCAGYRPKVIKMLNEEIGRLEGIMRQNMQKVIECTRKELTDWWDKCYISQQQRSKFRPFYEEDFTEAALAAHDQEVTRVKQYYKENEEMLEKVARRQKLWMEFLEFERKASDPNRLFNRGCNLLKEEKARKKLMKELPKVEQEVREQVEAWEVTHSKQFLVDGSRFVDYIQRQWLEYNDAKEIEKTQRHNNKVKETEQEMMYGSKPTPGKRRMAATGATPSKTPNKMRKVSGDVEGNSRMTTTTSSSTGTPLPTDTLCSAGGTTISNSTPSSSHHHTEGAHPTHRPASSMLAKPPIARVRGKVRQINETQKTPGSISRLAKTTMMQSPICMPPRSATRGYSKMSSIGGDPASSHTLITKTPGKTPRSMKRRSVSQPNLSRTPIHSTPTSSGRNNKSAARRKSRRHRKMATTGTPGAGVVGGGGERERPMYHSEDEQAKVLLQWREKCVSPQERPRPSPIKKPDPLFHLDNNIISPRCSATTKQQDAAGGPNPSPLYKSKSVGNLWQGADAENNEALGPKPNRPDAFFHMEVDQPKPLSPGRRNNSRSLFQVNNAGKGASPVKWTKTASLFSLEG